jgi:spore maturation protein CgeB
MRFVFSSAKNPYFFTITEYIENALKRIGECAFFDNRDFLIPEKIKKKMNFLHELDLIRLNKKLLSLVNKFKPDIFLEAGGHRILPLTIKRMRKKRIKTILWTIDSPIDFEPIIESAPYYDFVFCGGSEAYEILKNYNIKNLYWLPFACDPEIHRPVSLTEEERKKFSSDIVFVGTINPHLYPWRVEVLEKISDFNLSVWGPGAEYVPKNSPLKPLIKGKETSPFIWRKIYSAAKIVICIHYKDPQGKIPCYQASPRVYEVLACRKLLIVDGQKDVKRLFKDGKHLLIFRDIEDLREKIKYFLTHSQEREKIAYQGYREVIEKHTYYYRIREMLKVLKYGEGNI